LLGFPGEDIGEMEETVKFALELTLKWHLSRSSSTARTVEYVRGCETGIFDPEYFLHRITPEFNFPDSPIYVPVGSPPSSFWIPSAALQPLLLSTESRMRRLATLRHPSELWSLLQGAGTLIGNALSLVHPCPKPQPTAGGK